MGKMLLQEKVRSKHGMLNSDRKRGISAMPNWCKGNIRLRGKRKNIIDFLRHEISFVGTDLKTFDTVETCPNFREDDYEMIVSRPDKTEGLAFLSFYIHGTRRNFIDSKTIEYFFYCDEQDQTDVLCIDDFSAAWGIDPEPYIEKAVKYGIDIKIIGYEKGMMFRQEIEIVNGTLVKDETREWKETNKWYWEAENTNYGG